MGLLVHHEIRPVGPVGPALRYGGVLEDQDHPTVVAQLGDLPGHRGRVELLDQQLGRAVQALDVQLGVGRGGADANVAVDADVDAAGRRPWPDAGGGGGGAGAGGGAARAPPPPPAPLVRILRAAPPGRGRRGGREPPVTSRTKKFASLAPMSQVCAGKPPELFCSRRMAGVLLVWAWRSRIGVEVRKPTRPVLSMKIELVDAPASTVKGTLAPVTSSMVNLDWPPLAESLARSCQSLVGKLPALVSSNLIRRLCSFSRIVSKLKSSLLTQSKPTQRLFCTIRSSGITWSAPVMPRGPFELAVGPEPGPAPPLRSPATPPPAGRRPAPAA